MFNKKLKILKEYRGSAIIEYNAKGKEFYKILSTIEKHNFSTPDLFPADGSYGLEKGQYFELYKDDFYFSPYDLAKVMGYL